MNIFVKDLFKSGELLFVSAVLIVAENGVKHERIMMVFHNSYILFLQHSASPNEFDFDFRIQIMPQTRLKIVNKTMHPNCHDSNAIEIADYRMQSNASTRLLIVCSTQFDMRMLVDLITGLRNNVQHQTLNSKNVTLNRKNSITSTNSKTSQTANTHVPLPALATKSNNANQPVKKKKKKKFSIRPHPPLIPHFQLPNDLPHNTSLDGTTTLKRFMYKNPQLSEPFGKCTFLLFQNLSKNLIQFIKICVFLSDHGADDDFKLLGIIENYCKNKLLLTINVNAQEQEPSTARTSVDKASDSNEKNLKKIIQKLTEEKRYE